MNKIKKKILIIVFHFILYYRTLSHFFFPYNVNKFIIKSN